MGESDTEGDIFTEEEWGPPIDQRGEKERYKGGDKEGDVSRVCVVTHGAKIKCCRRDGCTKYFKKGGLCLRHGTKSIATSPGEAKLPPQPTEGFEATTAGVITWRGGEIDVCNMQANTSSATASQSPSPCPSATSPDSSDDEELGAWIYKNWHRLKRLE